MSTAPTDDTADRYRRLSQDFAATVAAVPPDGWARRSPCEDWAARDVVAHMIDTHRMFLGFVDAELGEGPSVDDDPAGAWDHARKVIQRHLDDPAGASATFEGFSGTTTLAAAADRFLCTDLVLHRWDLARSQGQDVTFDPADLDHVDAAMAGMADMMRGPGAFGPELEAPEGADRQTRFLAFYGRRA